MSGFPSPSSARPGRSDSASCSCSRTIPGSASTRSSPRSAAPARRTAKQPTGGSTRSCRATAGALTGQRARRRSRVAPRLLRPRLIRRRRSRGSLREPRMRRRVELEESSDGRRRPAPDPRNQRRSPRRHRAPAEAPRITRLHRHEPELLDDRPGDGHRADRAALRHRSASRDDDAGDLRRRLRGRGLRTPSSTT